MANLLSVRDLRVNFRTLGGEVQALRGVSFDVAPGECLAIVGESGGGKTVSALTVMGLVPRPPGRILSGSVVLAGRELLTLTEREWEQVRGREIGMIFQDPMSALNPTMTVGRQITEGVIKHQGLRSQAARRRAEEMLRLVGIADPADRLDAYPHQFSGGMRQRVVIAIALACSPRLLIADEPTTALDVTIQAQILALLQDLRARLGMAIILITHNLGVVAGLADRVAVMYAGQVVEQGTVADLFHHPQHPYTQGLLRSVPRLDSAGHARLTGIPGSPPDLFSPPAGCAFAARCDRTMRVCHRHQPQPVRAWGDHQVACWLQHPLASQSTAVVQAATALLDEPGDAGTSVAGGDGGD